MIKHNNLGQKIVLTDADGREVSEFDLGRHGLESAQVEALLGGFTAVFGHTSLEAQRQTFRAILKFVAFLKESRISGSALLPKDVLERFHKYLCASGLAGSTCQSIQNPVLKIAKWIIRNRPHVLATNASVRVAGFKRQLPKPRKRLSEEQFKQILLVCYEHIERTVAHIQRNLDLLDGSAAPAAHELDRLALTEELLQLGGGIIPVQKWIKSSLMTRVAKHGGLRSLRSSISVSPSQMFPFYLACLAQSGGNPMALLDMPTQCIVPHGLRSDLECLIWTKPRSRREQRVDFPKSKDWSAPNIVRRLVKVSARMRQFARPTDREKLFIVEPSSGGQARVPCMQLMHVLLDEFIAENVLPDFDFKDLRPFTAQAHHRIAGIAGARTRLNHRDGRTTANYLDRDDALKTHATTIAKFQGELSSRKLGVEKATQPWGADTSSFSGSSQTVFGFQCKDPLGGLDGVSAKGKLCVNFSRCSTCPGALVPLDDPAVVGRILSAGIALKDAREDAIRRGWLKRFNIVYEPTRKIIEEEIIPKVPAHALKAARGMIDVSNIPLIE
ncbi:hypothetical protein [Roseateles sp. MS654]|uniref:hypothetical protein n=1 Tax=Roseateles sp. MS654 TaxID=3412685 RepID=UPI003C30B551